MKLLKISLLSLAMVFSLVMAPVVFGEEKASNQSVTISTVFIDDLKIASQKDNVLDLSFIVKNGTGVHANSRVSLELLDSNQKIVDNYIVSNPFTIESDSEEPQGVTYNAPIGLNGNYTIRLSIGNDKGIPLAANTVEAVFENSSSLIELVPDSCFLSPSSNSENKVKIDNILKLEKPENIILSCQVKNGSNGDVKISPVYETHKSNLYGEVLEQKYQKEEFVILTGEEKLVSFNLPATLNSGDYVTQVSLDQGRKTYARVIAKYSIGEKDLVQIKNVSIDKTSYNKGEKMTLSVLWSYVTKEDVSLKMNVSVFNKKGESCLPSFSEAIVPKTTFLSLEKELTLDCNNPNVKVEISNEKDEVLAQEDVVFESVKKIDKSLIVDVVILILIIILVVAGIIIFFVKPKNNKKDELKNNENTNNENIQ